MRKETFLLLILGIYLSMCSYDAWSPPQKLFKGDLSPMDPKVCTTQNITFTCRLLDPPRTNSSIVFVVQNESTAGKRVIVDEEHVSVLNETVSQLTVYNISLEKKTIDVYYYVSCYYLEFAELDDTLRLGGVTSAHIFPAPEAVRDFNCIVFNYEAMRCSWDYGKEYGIHFPEVLFQWRIPTFSSSWNDCRSNGTVENGFCLWNRASDGYFKNVNITFNVTVTQTECDMSATSILEVDTSKIVKPNPVVNLKATPLSSTCIMVSWMSTDSEPQHPKEHKVVVKGANNITEKSIITTEDTEKLQHTMTFCHLRPHTEYTFSVSIKPTGIYSGYYSDDRLFKAKTYTDKPSASPVVTEGGFSWQPRECQGGKQRQVCTFWKPIKEEDKNGFLKGIVGTFTPKNISLDPISEDWSADSTYGCTYLLCNTSYMFSVTARNSNGTSTFASVTDITSAKSGVGQPLFVVESANSSKVFVSWNSTDAFINRGFLVAWCRNKNGRCMRLHEINWKRVPAYTTETAIEIDSANAAQDFLYGVSALTDHGSSGLEWQDCVYLKHAEPNRPPQNVIVSEGPDDNTLIVTWDKLTCASDEPYIHKYNITYTNLKDGYLKSQDVKASTEARLVLVDLEEDQPYKVTVKGVTRDGHYGPESKPQTAVPVNRNLKAPAIVGISMSVLVCVIFAGVGCFCAFRRCKNKAKKVILEAGKITIPGSDGLQINTVLERQDSNDSGYDMTPPHDKADITPDDFVFISENIMTEDKSKHQQSELEGHITEISKQNISENSKEAQLGVKESQCILKIPTPSAFCKETICNYTDEENNTTESGKDKNIDYVKARKASTNISENSKYEANDCLQKQFVPENKLIAADHVGPQIAEKRKGKLNVNQKEDPYNVDELRSINKSRSTSLDTTKLVKQIPCPKERHGFERFCLDHQTEDRTNCTVAISKIPSTSLVDNAHLQEQFVRNSGYITLPKANSQSHSDSGKYVFDTALCQKDVTDIPSLNVIPVSQFSKERTVPLSLDEDKSQVTKCNPGYVLSAVNPISKANKQSSVSSPGTFTVSCNGSISNILDTASRNIEAVDDSTLSHTLVSRPSEEVPRPVSTMEADKQATECNTGYVLSAVDLSLKANSQPLFSSPKFRSILYNASGTNVPNIVDENSPVSIIPVPQSLKEIPVPVDVKDENRHVPFFNSGYISSELDPDSKDTYSLSATPQQNTTPQINLLNCPTLFINQSDRSEGSDQSSHYLPLKAVANFKPHREKTSEKQFESNTSINATNQSKIENGYVCTIPGVITGSLLDRGQKSDVETIKDEIQNSYIASSLVAKSPEHFISPAPDTYKHLNLEYSQSDTEDKGDKSVSCHVDETFANALLKKAKNIIKETEACKAQIDGYVSHSSMDNLITQLNAQRDKKYGQNIGVCCSYVHNFKTNEFQCKPILVDGYLRHEALQQKSGMSPYVDVENSRAKAFTFDKGISAAYEHHQSNNGHGNKERGNKMVYDSGLDSPEQRLDLKLKQPDDGYVSCDAAMAMQP